MSSDPTPDVCPRCQFPLNASADPVPPEPGTGTITVLPGATPLPPSSSAGIPDRVGRFQIKRFVGEGAFGRVFEAYDPALKRTVALKVARPEQTADAHRVERFQREARSAGLLLHPNIVAVFDSGQDGPHHYIASAFVPGRPLVHLTDEGKAMPPRQAAEIARKLADALATAHKQGVIHRDVKPHNVMLRDDGEPLLMDFGLAARADEDSKLTVAGQFMGTPAYCAPEQWRGEACAASDQYSLGFLLYEMVAGKPPFEGRSPEHYLVLHAQTTPPSPRQFVPGLSRDLETIVLKCLEKDPARRYPDCAALADDLRRWLAGEAITARRAGPIERLVRWARREPVTAALVGAVMLSLAVGGALATWQWSRAVAALARADREQQDRTRAQLGALRTAAPAAVPSLLDDLRDKADLLPRLREAATEESDQGRRMRLALALLPHDPDAVRDDLAAWMLKAEDPAEVLLVRDRLQPHAEALRAGLWEKTGLRSRAALAAFDPADTHWKDEAERVLNEILLPQNALHLGTWVRGFEPVRAALLGPLGKVFREKDGDRKQTAVLMLKDYAADDAGLLADLLLDADPKQYAVLRFALDRHREKMIARMTQELKRVPDWWDDPPLNPAWQEPAAEVRQEIERAGGLMAERFALCQALPMERLTGVTEALRTGGYRPVRVRPHPSGVAVVWHRDGKAWKMRTGLKADEVSTAKETGMVPADVGGYGTADGDRYALLLVAPEKGEEAIAHAAIPAAEHRTYTDGPKGKGFVPATVQGLLGADGVVRFAGVWTKRPGQPIGWNLTLDNHPISHDDRVFAGQQLLLDVGVHARPEEKPEPPRRSVKGAGPLAWKAARADNKPAWVAVEESLTGPQEPGPFVEVARARVLAARVAAARHLGLLLAGVPAPGADVGRHLAAAEGLLQRAVDNGAVDGPVWADDKDFAVLRGRPAFAALTAARPDEAVRYCSTWAWNPAREGTGLHGLTREAHLVKCRELTAKGWRPAGLSLAGGLASSVWHRPAPTVERSVAAGRREAAAAATLLNLQEPRATWPVWKHRPDPTAQSYLTALAGPLGVDADALVKRLDEEKDPSARRALILALGEYADKELPAVVRGPLVTKLLAWYRDDPDPGVHGAIDWLLRHGQEGPVPRPLDWGQAKELQRIDADPASRRRQPPEGPRHGWTVNVQGQRYVVVRGPVEYRMGSPPWDAERQDPKDEKPHRRIIRHGFAIAASPVTVREWRRFLKESPEIRHSYLEGYAPQPDCPIVGVTMYEAMAYCNWLSKKEGLPEWEWCYPGKIEPGMKVPADLLRRKGYRLPMEAEWEYAARAGAESSRSFGEGEELRRRHAWYLDNAKQRTWPTKMKRPNGLGLSDVHGNASCWCHDPGAYYPDYAKRDAYQHMLVIEDQRSRILRGGAFDVAGPFVRSADRNFVRPWSRVSTYGVRPCRTYD